MFSLNGKWEFYSSKSELESKASLKNYIQVPSCIEEFFEGHIENFYLRKRFKLFPPRKDKRYFLNFEAVDYSTEVYLNGQLIGSHTGGYTPFSFEVTNLLREENDLIVHVFDPIGEEATEILHGKQNGIPDWYGNTSGIWRDVYIEEKGENFFEDVYVDASYLYNKLKIRGNLDGKMRVKINLSLGNEVVPVLEESFEVDSKNFETEFEVENVKLWSPENPNLYYLRLELIEKDRVLDVWKSKIGFRDIKTQNGKIFLNDKEFFIRGALDQDFYPLTLYTTPSVSYLKDEFIKAKEMGLNLLRCHLKVPDRRYLNLADEIGLLVWEEIPNFGRFSNKSINEFKKVIEKIIRRDYNHPSFTIFTIINESWGLDLSKEEQREWLLEMYEKAKGTVGNRLIVDNSACYGNFHVRTDINDFHFYNSFPDHKSSWQSTIRNYASKKYPTFSAYGDAQKTGEEPLLISEFGIWGLPSFIRDIKRIDRPFRGVPETIPEGVEDRFFTSPLSKHFKDYETFAILTQKEQFNALKYQLEEIRLYNSIKGYVITEFTDVFWEANGLLDMHRRPKWYFDLLKMLNSLLLLIPRSTRYSYFVGEDVNVEVTISNYSQIKGKGYLLVKLDGNILNSKEVDIKQGLARYNLVIETGKVKGLKKIWFEIINREGVFISKNYMDVVFLENLGFRNKDSYIEIINLEKEGSHTFGNTQIDVLMKKDMLSGDWVTNFNWMDPILFDSISEGGIMDIRHLSLLKNDLMMKITGDAHLISGTTYGWIYGNFAYAAVIEDKDRLRIITTFPRSKEEPINLAVQEIFNHLKMGEFS